MSGHFRAVTPRLVGLLLGLLVLFPAAAAHAQPANRAYYWTEVTASAPWPARAGHAAVNFKNRIWIIGGGVNDVWSSSNGRDWKLETDAVSWLNGRGRQWVVVLGDKLWVVGNYYEPNDIWNSADGATWTQVTPDAPWGIRSGAGIAAFHGKLWVLGDEVTTSGADSKDVWSSSDGIQWEQVGEHGAWTPLFLNTVVFQDRLWLIGGFTPHAAVYTVVYYWAHDAVYSTTGESWTSVHSSGVGYFGALAVFDNQLWDVDRSFFYDVFQTGTEIEASNEVWRSQDAADWQQMPSAPWSARYGQATVAFDGKLWVLGGGLNDANYTQLNDVWNLTPVSVEVDAGQRYLYNAGDPMTLKVKASALSGTVQYQWSKNGNAIPDATSDTYHVDAFSASDAGAYTCELTGDTFGTAGPVEIGVAPPKVPAAGRAGLAAGILLAAALFFFFVKRGSHRVSASACRSNDRHKTA